MKISNTKEMNNNLSIMGEFLRFLYKSENFSVMLVKVVKIVEKGSGLNGNCPAAGKTIACVGPIPEGFFYDGAKHIIAGKWTNTKYGFQLKIEKIDIIEPHGKAEIVRFLSSGLINGIGPVTAQRIVECFGKDTLEVLDRNPQAILQVKGIGQVTSEKIMSSWKE
ncbi:MAG: helix-hairpin-helix domain-containing protein, partial [Proteobacteria bacterium]|nr:helix-hairpin-helix domain-containing protein [Pseudomonadota bacterium]